jgi:hypothetical protein
LKENPFEQTTGCAFGKDIFLMEKMGSGAAITVVIIGLLLAAGAAVLASYAINKNLEDTYRRKTLTS